MIFRKDCFAPYACDFELTLSPMRLQMGFCIDSLGALNVKTVAEASSFCSVMLKFYPMAQQENPTKERDPIRKSGSDFYYGPPREGLGVCTV
jgi:hypothetical protein